MDAYEYYRLRYPYDQLVTLLTCNGDELHHTEFAIEGTDTFKRFVSVRTAQELKAAVLRIPNVSTFHFGPIYTGHPCRKRADGSCENASVPHRRVLSFDVDLTDYDWIGLNDKPSLAQCDKAYPVSAIALHLLKRLLEKAFAFTKVLMVYSGRRGVHVHVFDERAMALSNEGRSAVACYLNNSLSYSKNLRSDADVLRLMVMNDLKSTVYGLFETVLVGRMDLFGRLDERVQFVNRLGLEQYPNLAGGALLSLAEDSMDPDAGGEAWEFIQKKVHGCGVAFLAELLDAVVLAYVWPRLDYQVTAKLDHLTKVPFAAHAKTQRVAVAIDPDDIDGFDPASAPILDAFDDDAMAIAVQRFHIARECAPTRGIDTEFFADVCDVEDLAKAHEKRLRPHPRKRVGSRQKSMSTSP